MSEPEFQKQHRISEVYLKQFGYKKDGKWWISVYQKGKEKTENILIKDFTNKETNIFDLPFQDFKTRRHFENTSSKIEVNYVYKVLHPLYTKQELTRKGKDVLNHFVPNLMCRTDPFRSFIDSLLRSKDTREKFIEEMTIFKRNSKEAKELLSLFKIDFQLNLAMGILMNHMVHVFKNFKIIIIKDCENKGCLTTDNPVYMDKQERHEWIIPWEAEIYFPLSKDFCLFMYSDSSEIDNNPLRKLRTDQINSVDPETFKNITDKIVLNLHEYLIMNTELESTDVTLP